MRFVLESDVKVGILGKWKNPKAVELMKNLLEFMKGEGFEVYIEEGIEAGTPVLKRANDVDLILVLGGDGTLLRAVRFVGGEQVPIMGINLGGLGFMTWVNVDEVKDAILEFKRGKAMIEERMMLNARLLRDGEEVINMDVLNDVVINKGALARLIQIYVEVDGTFLSRYRADGLIISTPTGSTAYSLAANGPVVEPHLECIILSPICPHTLTDRPIILSSKKKIIAKLERGDEVYLTLDGQVGIEISTKDVVEVKRSERKAYLVRPTSKNYYSILRQKLGWGSE